MTAPEVLEAAAGYPGALPFMALQLVDSSLLTTREFWRKKFFGATDDEARDSRPFREVLAARQSRGGDDNADRKEVGHV